MNRCQQILGIAFVTVWLGFESLLVFGIPLLGLLFSVFTMAVTGALWVLTTIALSESNGCFLVYTSNPFSKSLSRLLLVSSVVTVVVGLMLLGGMLSFEVMPNKQ